MGQSAAKFVVVGIVALSLAGCGSDFFPAPAGPYPELWPFKKSDGPTQIGKKTTDKTSDPVIVTTRPSGATPSASTRTTAASKKIVGKKAASKKIVGKKVASKKVVSKKITSTPATRKAQTKKTQPRTATSSVAPAAVAVAQPNQQRTAVGEQVTLLSQNVDRLRGNLRQRREGLDTLVLTGQQRATAFYSHLAAMSTHLRRGTTPGNPVIVSRMNQAQAVLDSVTTDVTGLKRLYGDVSSDSSLAVYLNASLSSTYSLYGAVDSDHDQLDHLKDDVGRLAVDVDRLLNELTQELSRQAEYLATEQDNLRTMQVAVQTGELYGGSLKSAAAAGIRGRTVARASDPTDMSTRRPFVVLNFSGDNLNYERQLYQATRQALANDPDVIFDLIATSTTVGDTAFTSRQAGMARARADEVLRTLVGFGLPAQQVTLTDGKSNAIATHEVRIFVR